MFISMAHAASEVGSAIAPSTADAFWSNMGLIGVMFVLFYLLLIRPQQKRLKEQRSMLDTLKKGDKIVTGGGLVGVVSKIISDTEVEVDLGGTKIVALRYTIQTRMDDSAVTSVTKSVSPVTKKKVSAKKTAPKKVAKKAPAKKKTAKKKA